MFKYLIVVLVLIFGALAWMNFGIAESKIFQETTPELSVPHLYYDENRSIENIHISVFYFVPKNKTEFIIEDWKNILDRSLEKLQRFHSLQFQGRSKINYKIYPEPIIGLNDSIFYDTENTAEGNRIALISIATEIEKRLEPTRREDGAHPVLFIMYEGVGAVGGPIHESGLKTAEEIAAERGLPEDSIFIVDIESVDGFFLVNSAYLAKIEPFGESVFAHEFYHSLGAPDAYEPKYSIVVSYSNDLMGIGRRRPLENTYLRDEVLENFGL